jgi:hypothetical protein
VLPAAHADQDGTANAPTDWSRVEIFRDGGTSWQFDEEMRAARNPDG